MKNSNKNNNSQDKSNYIILILVIGLLVLLVCNKDKAEGFQGRGGDKKEPLTADKAGAEITDEIVAGMEGRYPGADKKLLKEFAKSKLLIETHGLNPSNQTTDLSKYVLKSRIEPQKQDQLVEDAKDKDQYIHKNSIPYQPKLDLDKYVLKSSIPPEKKCLPQKDIDYSKYVLKSSIPPVQKCPPCVCPEVKVSAGLCKKNPPPPKCPAPERCPAPPTCPEMKPCPANKEKVLHDIKYIKVPTFIEKKIVVDKTGKVIREVVNGETVSGSDNNNDNYNNNNNYGVENDIAYQRMIRWQKKHGKYNKVKHDNNDWNDWNNNNNHNPENNQNGWDEWQHNTNNNSNMVESEDTRYDVSNDYNNSNLEQTQHPKRAPRPKHKISRGGEARLNDHYFELNSDYSSKSNPITGHQQQLHF